MRRITIRPACDALGDPIRGTGGWFDLDAATTYPEGRRFDGNTYRGSASGIIAGQEEVIRTAGGRWVLHHDASRNFGGADVYTYITADEAQEWMVRAEVGEATLLGAFPQTESERGPGQPQIGTVRKVTLPDADWGQIGDIADDAGVSRSEIVRRAVAQYLAAR